MKGSLDLEGVGVAVWAADDRLTTLVRERGAELLRFAVLTAGGRENGEDVYHDALISVARSWPTLRSKDDAFAYTRRAIARKAIDAHRRRKRDSSPELAMIEDQAVDDGLFRVESDSNFVQMLQTLPRGQRTILVLRFHSDLTYEQIADELNCSIGNVKSQASRGLTRIREITRDDNDLHVEACGGDRS